MVPLGVCAMDCWLTLPSGEQPPAAYTASVTDWTVPVLSPASVLLVRPSPSLSYASGGGSVAHRVCHVHAVVGGHVAAKDVRGVCRIDAGDIVDVCPAGRRARCAANAGIVEIVQVVCQRCCLAVLRDRAGEQPIVNML